MRQGEFWEALYAYRQEKDTERIHIGELVRGAAIRLFNIQLQRKDQITDLRKFWKMPWDEEPLDESDEIRRLTHLTAEEKQAEVEKFFARTKNNGTDKSKP